MKTLIKQQDTASKSLFLPNGYESQSVNVTLDANRDDDGYWSPWRIGQSGRYQVHVYRWAERLIRRAGFERVLDIGCGVGTKLEEYIAPTGATIVGLDQPSAITNCQRLGRTGSFFEVDLESPDFEPDEPFDLILFADVVEHLIDPIPAMEMIRRVLAPDGLAWISTPERARRRGRACKRSEKPEHVREWARGEFVRFVKSCGLTVHSSKLMPQDDAPMGRGLWREIGFQAHLLPRSPYACHTVLCGKG
jgi:2-polyprenyl-3-methyl-5-hydroxy-6-metoxy-1,4-benzoquinol methylase